MEKRKKTTLRKQHRNHQSCANCLEPMNLDFIVPDDLWEAVAGEEFKGTALCLYCFDNLAGEKDIEYADLISRIVFVGRGAIMNFTVSEVMHKREFRPDSILDYWY